MPTDLAALTAELDAEQRATIPPAECAALQARVEREMNREKSAVKLDGEERYNYRDGSSSYVRTRPVSFVVEPRSHTNPALVLRCLNGITGHENWYAADLLEVICGQWAAGRTRFSVCGGTNGRYAFLTVDLGDLRDMLRDALVQA